MANLSKKLQNEKNNIFPIPHTTINIGKIIGGDAVNKVPDRCYIEFDARTVNSKHNALIIEKAKKYNAKINIITNIKPIHTKQDENIKEIEKITKQKLKGENFVTEASFIPNTHSIILGVGPITSHQSDEYIEMEN